MLKPFCATYHTLKPEIFVRSFISNNVFMSVEVKSSLDEILVKNIDLFFKKITFSTIDKIADLENLVYDGLKEFNLPTSISVSLGYVRENIFYLKTIGDGMIFIKRQNNFVRLIESDNCATGYIKEDDLFIFTVTDFVHSIKGEKEIKKYLTKTNPHEIVESINTKTNPQDREGIAFFVSFNKEREIASTDFQEEMEPLTLIKPNENNPKSKKKTITFVIVIIIFVILVWSVGLGYSRRLEAGRVEKIKKSEDLIKQKLDQAIEVAFINLPRSKALIAESRDELASLTKSLGTAKTDDLKRIADLINEKENGILKKDEKMPTEFYDLALEGKNIQTLKMTLYGDNLTVLSNEGKIYVLSLSKKSLETKTYPEIKKAQSLASYESVIFFYIPGGGIYKIDNDKLKKVINNDSEWGNILDFTVYNANLYLLDQSKHDIYKYMSGDNDNYSEKQSYFGTGESSILNNPNSLSIDQSIYVGQSDKISKFTSGARDDFNTTYPEDNISIIKVYTARDLDKVYVWDKNKGSVYVLGKNGMYEKQITSTAFNKANDLVVYKDSIFILLGTKIYQIGL